ncbi:MAG: NAD-dependent epimerase/dehydratase family protein [Thalassospira sp.]|uniref:NAD-dependent epimerase/dehydratase family protein n=1 Tax=Thalassospira sp. TaxID=1912094 RepID=UPI003A887DCE
MSKNETRTALVIGANGGIGSEVSAALLRRGWNIRALVRTAPKPKAHVPRDRIDWRMGDAMSSDDVLNAARGVDTIIHAVNPPGYRNWQQLVLPMLDNTIRAAIVNKARIVLPGTVYNFAPETLENVTEDSPQHPRTRKGAIRAEMERRLENATTNGAKALIVRAGDYFGANAGNNWFSQCLVKPGKKVSAITYPGKAGIGHQWAYLPDVAETMARLLDHETEIEPFALFHMEGHWDHDGTQMINAMQHCVGRKLSIRRLPWPLINLLRPISSFCQEASEVRYLWQHGYKMDNHALISILGEEPRTDLITAVGTSLNALGCIEDVDSYELNETSRTQTA